MTATRTPVTELGEFCELTYGVPRLQARILVSTFLQTRYEPLWIMIDAEKCKFLYDLENVLQRLDFPGILDTVEMRKRAYLANKYIDIIRQQRQKPWLFANRYWDWPGPFITPRSRYGLIAQECLRLRLEFDPSKLPGAVAKDILYQRVVDTLGAATVGTGGIVPWPLEEVFARRAGRLPLIDRMLVALTPLMRNFGYVMANHAAICGRAIPNEEDEAVQRYMLRHAVPLWCEKILRVLLQNGQRAISWKEIVRRSGQAYEWQWSYGGPGRHTNRPPLVGKKIIHEFWISGLVERNIKWNYVLKPQYTDDLEHIIEARA